MDNVIKIDRELVARCKCGGQLWYIIVEKPDFEIIKGFQCSFCNEIIEIRIADVGISGRDGE